MKQIRVGIDPAFRKSGFAICVLDYDNSALFKVFKNGFLDFIGWAMYEAPKEAVFIVENSNLQNCVWQNPEFKKGVLINTRTIFDRPDAIIPPRQKNPMSVGKNQAASQYTVDLLRSLKYKVIEVSPLQKGKAWSDVIFRNAVYCNKSLLINFKNTEDERVAYQLATRNISQFKF